ncbi:hypothetical protein Gorai_018152, partial [Gossypium raimondii]|nr:hypothetical protein [Gossypium raimondii]
PVSLSQLTWVNLSGNLILAYQSLGVVYGDLSTSPLYVYTSTLIGNLEDHQNEEAIFGACSLIFWTLTLIPLCKYVFILLAADDNGEGGTFALYSLLCRHANFSLLPNQQASDEELSAYRYGPSTHSNVSLLKRFLEKQKRPRTGLLIVVLFGASMVIGDGVLTSAIAVMSSLPGLQYSGKKLTKGALLLLACVILISLFALQHIGTHKVAFMFAPIVMLWLISIFCIGLYNIIHWNPKVVSAIYPYYIIKFFRETGRDGWISLGGILLSITGTEAMYADLGHFTAVSIRLAFVFAIYPCLVVQYMGQAAFLSRNLHSIPNSFFESIPGLATATLMFITTFLVALVITFVWQKSIWISGMFLLFFGIIEGAYLSAALMKVPQGGWVPLVLSFIFMMIMYIWHYGMCLKYNFDMHNKVPLQWLLGLGPSLGIVRVPGIGLIYTELATGIPAIFSHFVTNLPAFHKVLVFICVKSVPVPYVSSDERFVVGRVCPRPYRMYRCIVRYGYKDIQRDDGDFENQLIQSLAEFIHMEAGEPEFCTSEGSFDGRMMVTRSSSIQSGSTIIATEIEDCSESSSVQSSKSSALLSLRSVYDDENPPVRKQHIRFHLPANQIMDSAIREELMDLIVAKEAGFAYIMGHSYVKARRSSSCFKKFVIDVGYTFLRKNCRGPSVDLNIPHINLIEVGMTYYV